MNTTDTEPRCHRIRVPPGACSLLFNDDTIVHTERLGTTARGEQMLAHCDAGGQIIEIELLGADKPCQLPTTLPASAFSSARR